MTGNSRAHYLGKRTLDMFGSAFGLIVLSPLMLVVGISILIESGRPIIFRQDRIGQHGVPFTIHKYRTMLSRAGADRSLLTIGLDARVTPLGRVLRYFKIDELPQLFDVLIGNMSLVGPRPEIAKYVETLEEPMLEVHRYKPGITDPASLEYWNESAILGSVSNPEQYYITTILPEKVRISILYAREATLYSDLMVIVNTITGRKYHIE